MEIFDESKNSEMALPKELTIFNRKMVNLENEIGILNSYFHSLVVKQLKSNIQYYFVGKIKNTETTIETLYDDFDII